MDITKEEGGQMKIAAHESNASTPQTSIEETEESTPDEGTEEKPHGDGPTTLVDLLG